MAWDEESIALCKKYAAEGVSARKMAPMLPNGVTFSAIIGYCSRHGIPLRGNEVRNALMMERLKAQADKPKRAHRSSSIFLNGQKPNNDEIKPLEKLPRSTLDKAQEAFRGIGRISFLDVRDRECHWPYDEDLIGSAPVTACGCEAVPTKPYCSYHHNLSIGLG